MAAQSITWEYILEVVGHDTAQALGKRFGCLSKYIPSAPLAGRSSRTPRTSGGPGHVGQIRNWHADDPQGCEEAEVKQDPHCPANRCSLANPPYCLGVRGHGGLGRGCSPPFADV